MRRLILAVLCFLAGALHAQVTVEVVTDQEQFLPSESLLVKVRITNRSGRTLQLGKDRWLAFSVQRRDNFVVPKTGEVPVGGEFSLDSAMMATKRVDLMPYYDTTRPGRYQVTATVRIPDWEVEISSPPADFEIVRGVKIWEQDFGVPPLEGDTPGLPEMRKYALMQANYAKQLRLYVRVTDAAETRVYRMLALAPMVSFGRPESQVDKRGRLHVLSQTGARSFLYGMLDPDGRILLKQTIDITSGSRPTLVADQDGVVAVRGGTRRVTADDFPPPKPPATPPEGSESKP